ncbi:hypothetical protein [Actinokineospora sp. NBRC 105648]|nr:hypothetical protein [Actinokineospora sp. NBRC 105648]GLZ41975.1 hypothetical protein Acsp05_55990 [Actinokineospora sp. NBRC 105648]
MYAQITDTLTLVGPTGPVDYLLHVEGDQAWFRWAEPTPDSD